LTTQTVQSDVLVIGGGLAGLVTAIECLRAGQAVTLVDRDTPERLGGLALWAFGGMALVDTPLQRRMKLRDSPEIALADWLRFGELGEGDVLPRQWASHYVEHSREQVYEWVIASGLKFMPAVNWVERGMQGDGNSLPRYHIVWGTSRQLTRRMIELMHAADKGGRLTLLSGHRVTGLDCEGGMVRGAMAVNEASGSEVQLLASAVVLAMGGINGSHEETRANWVPGRPMPATMLNGAHPFADGKLHHLVAGLGGQITHAGEMWNYAAGFPHPQPHFEGHGLSAIPCKSALWLDHTVASASAPNLW
jgi:predicted oxidoreductase